MACPRCQGLLLDEGDERRCVNCGHREFGEEDAMPRFNSEESRARWIESVRRSKAKKKAEREAGAASADAEDRPPPIVAVRSTEVAVVPSLDDKIVQLRAELEILEQARDILTR